MVDVEVQPHPDRIRRHQIIHIAILVERDLRISRARAQSPHDNCATTLLAPDQLGNRIDIFNRKSDDGGSFRHPAYLFRT